jgi:hypothetical protein
VPGNGERRPAVAQARLEAEKIQAGRGRVGILAEEELEVDGVSQDVEVVLSAE